MWEIVWQERAYWRSNHIKDRIKRQSDKENYTYEVRVEYFLGLNASGNTYVEIQNKHLLFSWFRKSWNSIATFIGIWEWIMLNEIISNRYSCIFLYPKQGMFIHSSLTINKIDLPRDKVVVAKR